MEYQQLARYFSRDWKKKVVDNQVPIGSSGSSETSEFVRSNYSAVYWDLKLNCLPHTEEMWVYKYESSIPSLHF